MVSFMVYNKPGGQTEHIETVIDADFRLRLWRYQYPTVGFHDTTKIFPLLNPRSSFFRECRKKVKVSDTVVYL